MNNDDRAHPSIARRNQRDVLGAIAINGPLSRTDIAVQTGLHAASVSRITKALLAAGLIRERSEVETPGKRGRRFIELEINPSGGFVISIAINALEQSVTLANLGNQDIGRLDLQALDITDVPAVLDAIVTGALKMIARNGVDPSRVLGVGVAVAGVIDRETGTVISSPTLGWADVPLRQALSEGLNLDVTVENLPNAINLAEYRFGVASGFSSTLLMNTALGIGSSLLLNGGLHRTAGGSGVLTGEVLIDGEGGRAARSLNLAAGGRGVLVESGLSVEAVADLSPNDATRRLDKLIDAAIAGDPDSIATFIRAGQTLGRFMAFTGSVLQPEAYLISGPLARVPAYAEAARAALARHLGEEGWVFCVSDMTNLAAARGLAIGTYLIDKDLDIPALGEQEAA